MEIRDTFITFAGQVQKTKKDVKVKSFVRNGKVVRAFDRNQEVNVKNDLAKKVAVGSLATLGGILGVGLAGAAVVKLRYNKNLVKFGKDIGSNNFPLDMKLPKEAKAYIAPRKIEDSKESLTFFLGGLEDRAVVSGEKLMRTTKMVTRSQKLDKTHEFIPLYHNVQVVGRSPLGEAQKIIDAFDKAAVQGYNMDSALMAKEIYKWHKLNPTKPINLITHSAGGFQGRDIPHILDAAGVDKKLMKVFSMGSPDYGIVDEIVPTMKLIHSDDMFAQAIPVRDGRIAIPSLERNNIVLGPGAGKEYRELMRQNDIAEAIKQNKRPEYTPENLTKVHAHFLPAYMNGQTPTSKRTLELLEKFLVKS